MADKPWWPSTIMPLPQGMEDYLAQSGMDDAGQPHCGNTCKVL